MSFMSFSPIRCIYFVLPTVMDLIHPQFVIRFPLLLSLETLTNTFYLNVILKYFSLYYIFNKQLILPQTT